MSVHFSPLSKLGKPGKPGKPGIRTSGESIDDDGNTVFTDAMGNRSIIKYKNENAALKKAKVSDEAGQQAKQYAATIAKIQADQTLTQSQKETTVAKFKADTVGDGGSYGFFGLVGDIFGPVVKPIASGVAKVAGPVAKAVATVASPVVGAVAKGVSTVARPVVGPGAKALAPISKPVVGTVVKGFEVYNDIIRPWQNLVNAGFELANTPTENRSFWDRQLTLTARNLMPLATLFGEPRNDKGATDGTWADGKLSPLERFYKHGIEERGPFKAATDPRSAAYGTGFGAAATQFGIDTAVDPITYVSGGAGAIGKGEKLAMAGRFAPGADLGLKYPEMVSKMGNVARYGVTAIPKHIREAEIAIARSQGITNSGFELGIKFAGQRIPGTQAASFLYSGTVAPVAKGLAEAARKVPVWDDLMDYATRKSLRGAVASGILKRSSMNTINPEFTTALGAMESVSKQRGVTNWALEGFRNEVDANVLPPLQAATKAGIPTAGVVNAIETKNLASLVPKTRAIADAFNAFKQKLYAVMQTAETSTRARTGFNIDTIGWLDDHVYHSLTPGARKFVYNKKYAHLFEDFPEFSQAAAHNLAEGGDTSSIRKLVAGESFLGTPLTSGTVEEINGIWAAYTKFKKIPTSKFFADDIQSVAYGYSYSAARRLGRLAQVETLWKFGPDAILPLDVIGKIVYDPELVKRLTAVGNKIRNERTRLLSKAGSVAKRKATATELRKVSTRTKDVLESLSALDGMMGELDDIDVFARTLPATQRGSYTEMRQAMTDELTRFRKALTDGQGVRHLDLQDARAEYLALYPDAVEANHMDKPLEWFHEQIERGLGLQPSAQSDLVPLNIYRQRLVDGIERAGVGDDVAKMSKDLDELDDVINAYTVLGERKAAALYARDGVVYGTSHSRGGDNVPFHIKTTAVPPASAHGDNFFDLPDATMQHAPATAELFDVGSPKNMQAMVTGSTTMRDIGDVFTRHGIVDETWGSVVDNAMKYGGVDPFYAGIPEREAKASLLQWFIDFGNNVKLGTKGRVWTSQEFFDGMGTSFRHVAAQLDPENADAVGRSMMNDWLQVLVQKSKDDGFRGVLVPMDTVMANSPKGESAILLHALEPSPKVGNSLTAGTQAVRRADGTMNPLTKSITENTTETAVSDVMTGKDLLIKSGFDTNIVDDAARAARQQTDNLPFEAADSNPMVNVGGVDIPRVAAVRKVLENEKAIEASLAAEAAFLGQRDTAIDALTRTRMAFAHDRTLATWTPEVKQALHDELGLFIEQLKNAPATGATKLDNAKWIAETETLFANSALFDDPIVAEAHKRVVTILKAEEARLAVTANLLKENIFELSYAQAGIAGKKVVDQVLKGWTEIKRMGVQIPDDILTNYGYNISRLNNPEQANKYFRQLDKYTNYWKRYVTATVGFINRNMYSGTFMNYTAGVTNADMAMGLRWATAQNSTKLVRGRAGQAQKQLDWMSTVGLTSPDQIKFGNDVMQRVAAVGKGVNMDMAMPVNPRWGPFKILDKAEWTKRFRMGDNPVINTFSAGNDAAERALRIPVALMSVKRGDSFEQTVALIRRIHFDYSDLSKLDSSAKQLIPFWIWSSRNVPLQIQQILSRPKAYYEYERFASLNPVRLDDPTTPEIEGMILPKYIRENNPMAWGARTVFSPDLPFKRLVAQAQMFAEPSRLLSQSTPWIKVPAEVWLLKKQAFTGQPFKDAPAAGYEKILAQIIDRLGGEGVVRYDQKTEELMMPMWIQYSIESYIPILAQINRVSGGRTGGKETLNERQLTSIMSWLGLPVKKVGDVQSSKELISQQFELGRRSKNLGQDAVDRYYEQGGQAPYVGPYAEKP